MIHLAKDGNTEKGWFVGPWNSKVPVPIGYANAGVNEKHYHGRMHEVYLVAQGRSTAIVDGEEIELRAGEILVVEPGEIHTFIDSTEDYLHFVIQTPFVAGDKRIMER